MKLIGIEEHVPPDGLDHMEERIKDMDEAGIDMQVLSFVFPHDPSMGAKEAVSRAIGINNSLAEVVKKYPDRFASFAVLAMQDTDAAADELERAVNDLGLKGTMIGSNIGGEYLDEKKFWVIFERAEKLGVPVYLHPGNPSPDMAKPFETYPILLGSMWGYAAEAGLHAMRLICSGLFDEFPDLKIILGHMGEAIPYWLWRIDNRWTIEQRRSTDLIAVKLKKKPAEYFRDNFYVSTSGMFWPPVLEFVKSVLGIDRILFAVDYPQESNEVAVKFIESVPMDEDDREKICHINAEKLFKL